MKIIAKTDYLWWTVGEIYDVIDVNYGALLDEVWYTILDDKGQKAELSSIIHASDFEIIG